MVLASSPDHVGPWVSGDTARRRTEARVSRIKRDSRDRTGKSSTLYLAPPLPLADLPRRVVGALLAVAFCIPPDRRRRCASRFLHRREQYFCAAVLGVMIHTPHAAHRIASDSNT